MSESPGTLTAGYQLWARRPQPTRIHYGPRYRDGLAQPREHASRARPLETFRAGLANTKEIAASAGPAQPGPGRLDIGNSHRDFESDH